MRTTGFNQTYMTNVCANVHNYVKESFYPILDVKPVLVAMTILSFYFFFFFNGSRFLCIFILYTTLEFLS